MNTLYISIAFFAFAASVGVYMLSFIFKDSNPPKAAAFVHGSLAIVGLLSLIAYCLSQPGEYTTPLALFCIAAVGGLVMITMHLTGKKIPKWIALGHGLLAVTGFVILLVLTF